MKAKRGNAHFHICAPTPLTKLTEAPCVSFVSATHTHAAQMNLFDENQVPLIKSEVKKRPPVRCHARTPKKPHVRVPCKLTELPQAPSGSSVSTPPAHTRKMNIFDEMPLNSTMGFRLAWGDAISGEEVHTIMEEIVAMIEQIAEAAEWPCERTGEVLRTVLRSPLSDLLPNLHHFRSHAEFVRADQAARSALTSTASGREGTVPCNSVPSQKPQR